MGLPSRQGYTLEHVDNQYTYFYLPRLSLSSLLCPFLALVTCLRTSGFLGSGSGSGFLALALAMVWHHGPSTWLTLDFAMGARETDLVGSAVLTSWCAQGGRVLLLTCYRHITVVVQKCCSVDFGPALAYCCTRLLRLSRAQSVCGQRLHLQGMPTPPPSRA